eukprot:PhF_6_TR26283/c1_g1_i1/m.37660
MRQRTLCTLRFHCCVCWMIVRAPHRNLWQTECQPHHRLQQTNNEVNLQPHHLSWKSLPKQPNTSFQSSPDQNQSVCTPAHRLHYTVKRQIPLPTALPGLCATEKTLVFNANCSPMTGTP